MHDTSLKDHLDAERAIKKNELNTSTFDVVRVDDFYNHNCSTMFWYFYMWILVFLAFILLAVDIYSCLNILVFHRWATADYKPYAYSVAKWIFTGCIIFEFVLLIYCWIWAIHIYRTKNIAMVYLNSICKKLYSIKSFSYFCLMNSIDEGKFYDLCCFNTYYEIQNAPQILIADTPRQVINILTLRYYATGGELNNDILSNIRSIAKTNLRLSIILSFMCLSVFIYAIFFIKFTFGMLSYIPLKFSLSSDGFKSFKSYCSYLVSKSVSDAVNKHHRPKKELREEGLLSEAAISELPQIDNDYPSDYKGYTRVYYGRSDSEESIPMKHLNYNGGRLYGELKPDLHQQPSFDQLQQSEQMFSTLNSANNTPFSKRLSTLRDKNKNKIFQQPQVAKSASSLIDLQPQPRYESLGRGGGETQTSTISGGLPNYKQRSRSDNKSLSGNDLLYNTQRMPSYPTRSYTADNSYDPGITNEMNSQIDLITSDPIRDHFNAEPHPKATTIPLPLDTQLTESQQMHISHQRRPIERSHTEDSQDPFSDTGDDKFVFEQPAAPEAEAEHSSPKSSNSGTVDDILDSYESNNSAPYPVRGVSKYFE
ncbi:KCH1 [Candida theae]|uniref:KCH1 n=1 Tax=Candida theae TaxID=1198502 RepID=A0AAD5BD01_9ASCO|nr:KCH1 [Candida theae]KAI5956019.1 KCH1 [Candida theae]